MVRRLPAGDDRLHRHARSDRSADPRPRRRRGADPRDRQHRRSGDAVRMVGRAGRLARRRRCCSPSRPRATRRSSRSSASSRSWSTYLVDLEMPDAGDACSDNDDGRLLPAGRGERDRPDRRLFDCLRENGADVPELTHRRRAGRSDRERSSSRASIRPIRRSPRPRSSVRTSSPTCDARGRLGLLHSVLTAIRPLSTTKRRKVTPNRH